MIEIISSWAKSLGVAIVLVSILEMILPNNKTKKYIRMVLGIFIIFNIIAPFIENKDNISLASINIEDYYSDENNVSEDTNSLNQTSMDQRIKILYQDELEKDIIKRIEEEGYEVGSCNVEAEIATDEDTERSKYENETGINKIKLKIEGKFKSNNEESQEQEGNIENKILTGVQRIKEIDINKNEETDSNSEENKEEENEKITRGDIQNIKKILIEEYGVSEKCLEIN